MKLNELKVGQSAVITAVGGEGSLRNRLIDMGLIPKTKLTLRKVAPMGDPIEIRIRGYELTLRLEDAANISIEPIEAEQSKDEPKTESIQKAKKPSIFKSLFNKKKKDDER